MTGHLIRPIDIKGRDVYSLAFSPTGRSFAYVTNSNNVIRVVDVDSGQEIKSVSFGDVNTRSSAVAFSADGRFIAVGSNDNTVRLWDPTSWQLMKTLTGHTDSVDSVTFSANTQMQASGSNDSTIKLWDVGSGREIKTLAGHGNTIESLAFLRDGRLLISGSLDATIKLWDTQENVVVATLISLDQQHWVVATPDGRFDTNKSLDRIEGLHWVLRTEIAELLPLDIFMRHYYEPRLLPRLLDHDDFKEVPPLTEINRVQPIVKITDVRRDGPNSASVTVEVENVRRTYQGDRNPIVDSAAKDLRLFRDGQLVGYRDGELLGRPRNTTTGCEPLPNATNACQAIFRHVKLPRQQEVHDVEFSAYAFNASEVKSETSRFLFAYKQSAIYQFTEYLQLNRLTTLWE